VGRLRRAVSEKRWQWFCALDGRLAVGGAVVDAGLFGTAFLWVADRSDGGLLVDADLLVPAPLVSVSMAPASGVVAMVDLPRRRLRVTRTDEAVAVDALAVEGCCEEDIDVGLLASRYSQPSGEWRGTVAGHDVEGGGVAERHRTR